MVVPFFIGMTIGPQAHACHVTPGSVGALWPTIVATALHAAGYLGITGILSLVVFEKVGVGLLRNAWLNTDVMWAAALVVTGLLTFVA